MIKKSILLFLIFKIANLYAQSPEIQWMSFESSMRAFESAPKKIFIDVYTDWCGWCKKMDQSTFKDQEIINILSKDYYPVKLDAEMKREILLFGDTLNFVKYGRNGAHELALKLLGGNMSYPSYVILDKDLKIKKIIKGYKSKHQLLQSLTTVQ
jgi:thioredoxin-related protein